MSGSMRKIGEYLGLLEDTGRYPDDEGYDDYDEAPTRPTREEAAPAPVASINDRRRPQVVPTTGTVAELSRITTLHPRTYNEARVIGEHFRDGVPVIMNLSDMEDVDAKRLVDFAAGLIFGLRGSIERVTSKVFLLSPESVAVSGESSIAHAEAEPAFAQS